MICPHGYPSWVSPPCELCSEAAQRANQEKEKQMSDTIRVIRVLEYVGPREYIEDHLERRSVKGTFSFKVLRESTCTIREAILGDFPEIIKADFSKAERTVVEQLLGNLEGTPVRATLRQNPDGSHSITSIEVVEPE